MSETTKTPNYNLIKPNVNADADLWGDHLNSDLDTLDTIIKTVENKAGVTTFNTRAGAVTLSNADVVTVLPGSVTAPLMDGTATAGIATTWSKSDHVHPIDVSRAAASAVPGISYADNGGFAINQRNYVSGTALPAGSYGHDRWKAGAGGCSYMFTQSGNPATAVTITAGTLQQVVEGAALIGGTYTLSWTGTAQGRVGGGSYAASPVTASVTASANTTIEFNAGTLGHVKFEIGSTATPWVANSPQYDLANCQRFYQATISQLVGGVGVSGQATYIVYQFPTTMHHTPTVTWNVSGGVGYSSSAVSSYTANGFTGGVTATATTWGANAFFTASADL